MAKKAQAKKTKKAKAGAKKAAKKAAGTKGKARRAKATQEPPPELKKRALRILRGLKKLYPDADCALQHRSAFELLVATILSAQSTDSTVNKVTPVLFARFPTPQALAEADLSEIEEIIYPTGFFRQKAKTIQAAARKIVEDFGGEVPDRMEDLITIPGVARKTANVVLGTWFKKNEGIVVDTHVGRLAHRLGLTWSSKNEKDAVRIEEDLMKIIPRRDWTFFGHAMIWHGRMVCTARKPACDACLLAPDCPSAFKIDGKRAAKKAPARGRRKKAAKTTRRKAKSKAAG